MLPGKIERHSRFLHLRPTFTLGIQVQRPANGVIERFDLCFDKCKTGFAIRNGIVQAAHRPDERNTSVTHGDHLRDAARLVARGHKENIRAAIDLAGQPGVVSRLDPDPFRHLLLQFFSHGLQPWIPCSQQNQLPVLFAEHTQALEGDIHTFLNIHAGDHTEHRDVGIDRQPHPFLERSFVSRAQGETAGVEIRGQRGVRLRIEGSRIQPVQYAPQGVGPVSQKVLQPASELFVEDFYGVGR